MTEASSWRETLVKSNLHLQVLLFFNVYLSIVWTSFFGYFLVYNIDCFGKIHAILTTFVFLLTVPAEVLRLYVGYVGNLRGNISDLGGFWILSALIQLPIHSYFTYTNNSGPFLYLIQCLMLIWIVMEIPIGAYASRKLSVYQAQLYHMELLSKNTSNDKY